jgi:hypothetical protein
MRFARLRHLSNDKPVRLSCNIGRRGEWFCHRQAMLAAASPFIVVGWGWKAYWCSPVSSATTSALRCGLQLV